MHNHSKHSSEQFLAVFIFLEKEHDCEIEKKMIKYYWQTIITCMCLSSIQTIKIHNVRFDLVVGNFILFLHL